jgi:uncharacterized protein (TIGR00297 family)
MDFALKALIVLLILVVISFISYNKKSWGRAGILVGNAVGILSFLLGGLKAFAFIFVLFVFTELGTRYSRRQKKQKFEKRGALNIIGNSSAALIALAFQNYVAFASAISCALSDTLSGELGMMTGKKPRLITTMEKVDVGEEGAVTLFGLVVGLVSAFIVAAIYFVLFMQSMNALIIITVAGFLGSIADSFLGALLERKKIIGNTLTNFLACSTSILLAVYLLGALV